MLIPGPDTNLRPNPPAAQFCGTDRRCEPLRRQPLPARPQSPAPSSPAVRAVGPWLPAATSGGTKPFFPRLVSPPPLPIPEVQTLGSSAKAAGAARHRQHQAGQAAPGSWSLPARSPQPRQPVAGRGGMAAGGEGWVEAFLGIFSSFCLFFFF